MMGHREKIDQEAYDVTTRLRRHVCWRAGAVHAIKARMARGARLKAKRETVLEVRDELQTS